MILLDTDTLSLLFAANPKVADRFDKEPELENQVEVQRQS